MDEAVKSTSSENQGCATLAAIEEIEMPQLSETVFAPELDGGQWIQRGPVSLKSLRDKAVVLIDFWDYTCGDRDAAIVRDSVRTRARWRSMDSARSGEPQVVARQGCGADRFLGLHLRQLHPHAAVRSGVEQEVQGQRPGRGRSARAGILFCARGFARGGSRGAIRPRIFNSARQRIRNLARVLESVLACEIFSRCEGTHSLLPFRRRSLPGNRSSYSGIAPRTASGREFATADGTGARQRPSRRGLLSRHAGVVSRSRARSVRKFRGCRARSAA